MNNCFAEYKWGGEGAQVVAMETQLESGRDPAKLDGLKCVGQLHTSNDGPVSGPSFYDVLLSAIWVFM